MLRYNLEPSQPRSSSKSLIDKSLSLSYLNEWSPNLSVISAAFIALGKSCRKINEQQINDESAHCVRIIQMMKLKTEAELEA